MPNGDFTVRNSARAETDVEAIFLGIYEIDRDWGVRWFRSFETEAASLAYLPERYGEALEAVDTGRPIRQLVFGKRGNRYRILYEITGSVVTILRACYGLIVVCGAKLRG